MTSQAVMILFLGLLFGVTLGALCTWLVTRSRAAADQSGDDARLAEARAAVERALAETAGARSETSQVRAELSAQRELAAQGRTEAALAHADRAEAQQLVSEARAQTAEVRSELATALAQRDAALARVAAIEADQQRLVDQFKVLSSEQLERQGQAADLAAAERQKQVDAIVAPLTQQLKDFQQQLGQMQRERVSISTELREQVRQVTVTGDQVRRETAALATALRKPQVRGQWGELQLKRVAELAGMVEHCHFIQQGTTTTSAETRIRPDMTVMLGEDKFVHVDSKVPLSAYLEAEEAADDGERERLMGQFTRNVRSHVDQLSGKEYWKSEVGTPEFVVMFIPMESLAAEALQRMPDLLQYASDRGIIVATPTSLIGLLKTVAYSWRQAALAENAMQVFTIARELHDRLSRMGGHVDKLGRQLGSAVKAYNEAVGSLEGRVLPSARKLRDLNVTDLQISSPTPIETSVRQVTAPELLEPLESPAPAIELTEGPTEALPEYAELVRPDPSLDDLLDHDDQPGSTSRHLRGLA